MAGSTAEIGRLHVTHAAIRKLAGNHDIKKGGYGDETSELTKLRISWINGLEMRWHFASFAHPPPAQINAKRNEQKAANKNPRQEQVDNDTHIRMHAAAAQRDGQKNQPGNRRRGDHNNTRQTDQVVREENNW